MSRKNPFYDMKIVRKYGLMMIGFFFACKVSSGLAFPLLVPIALMLLAGRKHEELFFVVLMAGASIITNSWLVPKTIIFGATQRGLLVMIGLLLAMKLFGSRKEPAIAPLGAMLLYILYMVFVSFVGWSPLISGLKLFLFTSIFLGFYATSNIVARQQHGMRKLRSLVLTVMGFFVVGSVLTIPFPAIGMMGGEEAIRAIAQGGVSLFKGITVHSQSLGPIVAMCGVLIFADLVFSIQRPDKIYFALLLTIPILIYRTSSRTAMASFGAGVLFVFWCAMRARSVRPGWRARVIQWGVLAGAIACMLVLIIPSVRASIMRFVVKYQTEGDRTPVTREEVLASRQEVLDLTLDNWRRSPVIGNGFQVSESMKGFKANSFKDILTAPVEKSTWIYAILEEGGVVGEFLFCVIALFILRALMKRRAYIGASCFFTMLVVNLGEFTIFSMSGTGGFFWGVIFAGCTIDARRERERLAMGAGAPPPRWDWNLRSPYAPPSPAPPNQFIR